MTKLREKRAALIRDFLEWLPGLQIVNTDGYSEEWTIVDGENLEALIQDWAEGMNVGGTNIPSGVIKALRTFRDLHGRKWKAALRALWDSGLDEGVLRTARNLIGPSGLDKVRL